MEREMLSAHERFVQDTIACQQPLYAFILSLTADRDWAEEVLQDTNVALLRKEAEFEPGSNFKAWACSVAYYQVLTSRKTRQRSRLVFDERLLQLMSSESPHWVDEYDARMQALRQCFAALSGLQARVLQRRYQGESVARIATDLGRSAATISQLLFRARQALKNCVIGKMARSHAP
jgi:RNA polymerase sigma-70 factor (ECF subfamily)